MKNTLWRVLDHNAIIIDRQGVTMRFVAIVEGGRDIALVPVYESQKKSDETARLIAAAPELLALCHSLIESPLGEFHELSDTDKDLMARLQPDSTAKDNPSRRTP